MLSWHTAYISALILFMITPQFIISTYISFIYERKIGKVFTSNFFRNRSSSYKKEFNGPRSHKVEKHCSNMFLESNNASSPLANSTAIWRVFVLCKLLITKQSVTIYVSALYKKTYYFYRSHNTAKVRTSQLVTRLLNSNFCNLSSRYGSV